MLPGRPELSAAGATAIAEMVLACLHREYPVHMCHLMSSAADVRAPRDLTPAFYGSFDWHSSVRGHWCLVRLARRSAVSSWRERALEALATSLTRERLAGEVAYVSSEGRQGFERPYGLAWLLQLSAELREWAQDSTPEAGVTRQAGRWLAALAPLESLAAERMRAWLARLPWPVRGGEHGQSAFALGLWLDWARVCGRDDWTREVASRVRELYGDDRGAPIAYEPSGYDFLSPTLAEADLMRRAMDPPTYLTWLERFLPEPGSDATRRWLTPVSSPDRSDGKLSHLDGLNLSRAWMMEGIASAMPDSHAWRAVLEDAASRHAEMGLSAVPAEHYAGMHWLGSFAVYLLTRRGLAGPHEREMMD